MWLFKRGRLESLRRLLWQVVRIAVPQTLFDQFDVHEDHNARDVVHHVLALLPRLRSLSDDSVRGLLRLARGVERQG